MSQSDTSPHASDSPTGLFAVGTITNIRKGQSDPFSRLCMKADFTTQSGEKLDVMLTPNAVLQLRQRIWKVRDIPNHLGRQVQNIWLQLDDLPEGDENGDRLFERLFQLYREADTELAERQHIDNNPQYPCTAVITEHRGSKRIVSFSDM